MNRNPILTRFEGRSRWRLSPPRNLHSAFLRPDRLPPFVQDSPSAMRMLDVLGPLAWDQFPERNLDRFWGQAAIPHAAFSAACLIKLEENLVSMGALRRYLVEHPAFILQQNAMSYVPRREMLAEVAADIRKVFNALDRPTAETYLKQTVHKYAQSASRLADWMETHLPEGLTVFAFPEAHRRKLRTNNSLERLNREIGRRTDVVGIFPNEAACLRLVSALLMEQDEEWQTGRVHLSFERPP